MTHENGKKCSCSLLSSVKNFIVDQSHFLLGAAAIVASITIRRTLKTRELRRKWNSVGKDVVVLHAAGPSKVMIHTSPFAIKADMYLTMAGIPFKHCARQPFGPKGKMPWITLNGEDLADSQMIVEHLGDKFNKDFSSHLTAEQKAVGRSMRIMMEDHLFWGLGYWQWVGDKDYDFTKSHRVPMLFSMYVKLGFMRRKFMAAMKGQGLGRHSQDEIMNIMKKDIEALSIYLGNKQFIMGDKPCELDCSVFPFIAGIVWGHPNNPLEKTVIDEYSNLYDYCVRVREKYYPEWQDRLLK